MSHPVAITLADLIRRGSGLDAHEAERLARAWSTEIRLELEQTGISVIRGVGTLTLTAGIVRFQQDPDFPIGSELPAVEGFSEAVAASLRAASAAPPSARPPVVPPMPSSSDPVEDPQALESDYSDAKDTAEAETDSGSGEAPPAWQDLDEVDVASASATMQELEEAQPGYIEETPTEVAPPAAGKAASPDQDDTTVVPGSADAGTAPDGTVVVEPDEDWSSGLQAAISQADARIEEGGTAPHKPQRRSRTASAHRGDSEGSSRWILAVAAVVALVIVAALIYRFAWPPQPTDPPAVAALDSTSVAAPDSLVGSAADSSMVMTDGGDEMAVDADRPTQPAETPQAEMPLEQAEPVDGGTVTAGMGGYTLIVGSTLNATAAERVRSRFTRLGLPTGVLAMTADSTTRYRIAVGHFATSAEADTLRIRKAADLPEGTWVLSVR